MISKFWVVSLKVILFAQPFQLLICSLLHNRRLNCCYDIYLIIYNIYCFHNSNAIYYSGTKLRIKIHSTKHFPIFLRKSIITHHSSPSCLQLSHFYDNCCPIADNCCSPTPSACGPISFNSRLIHGNSRSSTKIFLLIAVPC